MKRFLIKFITKYFKTWGCELETALPLEFIITEHAEQRILERVKLSPHKLKRFVVKAWQSKETPNQKLIVKINKREYFGKDKGNIVYRQFMGYVFVFKKRYIFRGQYAQKILITVY